MDTKHTHASITDTDIRCLLARDLWVLRISMRKCGQPMKSDWVCGIRMGLETMARRMNDWQRIGPEYLTSEYYRVQQ
jgi:hypothetical protein